MFKVYTYNYDTDTNTSWNTFEYTLDNLNGLQFETAEQVDAYSMDIQSTIYSTEYTVVGILDEGREDFRFVTAATTTPTWV